MVAKHFQDQLQHPAVLQLLSQCGGRVGIRKTGRTKLAELVRKRAPRMGARLVEQTVTALDTQTVVVPGTMAAETVLPRLADNLSDLVPAENVIWAGQAACSYAPDSVSGRPHASTALVCRQHAQERKMRHGRPRLDQGRSALVAGARPGAG
ncbi:hypothetical protein DMB66_26180 [Actinoplanes sp. ATCC 53533]|nr:hypothetical protein DMB66_26180 [Actinoplanes sp. ATCC 53533]